MFIFAADLHLSRLTFASCPDATYDSICSFRKILALADDLSNRAGEVCPLVLAGDIWDSTKVPPDVLYSAKHVAVGYDIPIYYVNGNHDATTPSWTTFLPRVTQLGQVPTTLPDGTRIVGMPFLLASEIPEYLKNTDKSADFLVCHQFIEATENSHIQSSIPLSVFKDFPRVLAGDIHRQHRVMNAEGNVVVYPGATNMRALSEDTGSCYVVGAPGSMDADFVINSADRQFVFRSQPIETRPVYRVYVTSQGPTFMTAKEASMLSEPLVPFTADVVPILEARADPFIKAARRPFLAIFASGFDTDAVHSWNTRAAHKFHTLYRRKPAGMNLMDDELGGGEGSRTGTGLRLALELLDDASLEDDFRDMCKHVLLHEEDFLVQSRKKLGLPD